MFETAQARTASRRISEPLRVLIEGSPDIVGTPDMAHVSASCAEHQNKTIQIHLLRLMRLTDGVIRKVENHAHAVALHMIYDTLLQLHASARTPSAMAEGISVHLLEIGDIVKLVEACEAKSAQRRPCNKLRS